MTRIPLIAGNWKMYKTIAEAQELAQGLVEACQGLEDCEILVCPPFTALKSVAEIISSSPIKLGAQNCYFEDQGAFTGEISPLMLKDVGCSYVILGHSERRHIFKETDELINRKVKAAIKHRLAPILCLGERLEERKAGETFKVVEGQLRAGLDGLGPGDLGDLVIAYEPVWAIGTGQTATPEQAQEVHVFIREILRASWGEALAKDLRILYGGSVKPDNIDSLMAQPDIDGVLVGGASLKAESFIRIIKYQG
ncbi:triose-phosphate isomerase [Thermosulfuriphilus sp.]